MAQRRATKHVEGGSGWAETKPRLVDTRLARPRAILAAVDATRITPNHDGPPWSTEESLDELSRLADSGDIEVVRRMSQRLSRSDPRTYFGEGKVRELAQWMEAEECDIALFDDELSPGQQKSLEQILGQGKVVDRTQLILDIFAARAHTREGYLQVELARAQYQMPRLRRLWTHLERQRGGTLTRGGAGETQMETDRRALKATIKRLERELETVRARRTEQRRARHERWPTVALVGYTNAGKSTLLNRLTGADAAARDQLFATLDPTTRRWSLPGDNGALLTDTVGFIHKLPAALVAAFRATLEESTEADLLLHVVDASSPHAPGQAAVVLDELEALGASSPVITVLNKVDLLPPEEREAALAQLKDTFPDGIPTSAHTGEGCDRLAEQVRAALAAGDADRRQGVVPS